MTWLTTGGPSTNSWATSRTITEKCPSTALAAPMPTTLPSSTLTTGTVESCSANIEEPRCPGRNEPPPPATRGRPAVIAPELSLAALSPSACCLGTIAATLAPHAGVGRARREAGVGDVLQGLHLGQHRRPAGLAVRAGPAGALAGRDGGDDLAGRDRGACLQFGERGDHPGAGCGDRGLHL